MANAGNRAFPTPRMDRLAAAGARAALLTVMSPWRHGMLGYGRIAGRYPHEKLRLLKQAGYFTGVIGKLHYSPHYNTHGYGMAALDESGRSESPDFR